MIPLCIGLHLTKQLCTQPGLYWTVSASPLQKLGNEDTWINCATFGLAVFFIMMMDTAGSPIEYVRAGGECEHFPAEKKNSIIKYSLWIDSGFNIVAPLMGVSPIVYYAENHVGWKTGGRSGWTAGTVAACFLLFAVIGAISIYNNWPISELIPKFAIMPPLFFVGLMIVAESFSQRFKPVKAEVAQLDDAAAVKPATQTSYVISDEQPLGRVLFFFPAAITLVMVTITFSFDAAMAAGILSYALISWLPEEYVGPPEPDLGSQADSTSRDEKDRRRARELGALYTGALAVLLLNWHLLGRPYTATAPTPASCPVSVELK